MTTIIRYSLVALVVVILSLLAWWYVFLSSKEDSLQTSDLGRGAGITPPSFGEAIGSTYNNISENVSSFIERVGSQNSEKTPPRLRQVTRTPVAGMDFVLRKANTQTIASNALSTSTSALRFVERGTGYIFDSALDTQALVRITNTLVPQTYEALVAKNGGVILRNLEADTVVTSFASATSTMLKGDTAAPLSLSPLPKNIRGIAFSPSGEEILYTLEEQGGGTSLMRAGKKGEKARRVATLGIVGWQLKWLPDNRIVLVQNAEEGIAGYSYELKTNGMLEPLIGNISGLVLSLPIKAPGAAKAGALLYSSSALNLTLSARANAAASTATLPIRTTADKCAWNPVETLIAYCAVPQTSLGGNTGKWFRGEVHTTDTWWKIDVGSGRAEILYAPEGGLGLDVESPTIDPEGTYIAFLNGADKSLWLLRLSGLPAKASAQVGE